MTLERISRHFGEAIVKLIPPLWGRPVIAAILRSYINQVQELEDAAFEVMGAFDVNTCDATRLAVLGRVVGQPNQGWDTETYRAVVRAKIATNRSHGREDDIVQVVRLVLGPDGDGMGVTVTSFAPAAMRVEPTGGTVPTSARTALRTLLPHARAAGVQQHLVARHADPGLVWGSTTGSAPGTALASSVSGGGAVLASVYLV